MSRLLENWLKRVNPRGYQGGQGWLWWALTHDRRLDLVAVLPSRSTATDPFLVALPQQFVTINCCRVA